jgi:uncharacterized protein (TIGR03000 family)
LDRVSGKWAQETNRDKAELRNEIQDMLRKQAEAPLGGWAGVELVNVLEVNLALRKRYESGSGKTASLEPSKSTETAGVSGASPINEKTSSVEAPSPSATSVAVNGDTPKSAEKGKPSQETTSATKTDATKISGVPAAEEKKQGTPGVEPKKPSTEAVASEKPKPADKRTTITEPGKASNATSVAGGPALKSAEAKKPSAEPAAPVAEPTKPSKTAAAEKGAKPIDEAKAPTRSPKAQPAAESDKPSKAVVASEKEKSAEKPAAELSKAASPKATPSQPAIEPRRAESPAPKVSQHADVATIVVRVPADAKVYFDGRPTQQTGEERTYVTPSLRPGSTFVYTLRTEIISGGRLVSKTERVAVRAGETITVEPIK